MMNKFFYVSAITFLILTASTYASKPVKKQSTVRYHYILDVPENYDDDKDKQWPLIIYLHGKSACGTDLGKVKRYGLPFFTGRGMKLEAIAVSPQCPAGKNWITDNWLEPMLKELTSKYRIDTDRIYLTGMSLGGFGTWDLAIKYPDKFAAIAPLCGGGRPENVCAIKDVPVWVFHGDKDEQVPISRSREMVDALRKCGGNPKFTILKGFPHDIHRTYSEESLYSWMFQYDLKSRKPFDINTMIAATDTFVKELPPYSKYPGKKKSTVEQNSAEKVVVQEKPVPAEEKTIAKEKTSSVKEKTVAKRTAKSAKEKEVLTKNKPVATKEKIARNAQTDTIKGKDFILVF